jgi:glycerophosphoryl diester phosphodiesterase
MKNRLLILLLALCIAPFLSISVFAATPSSEMYETDNDISDTKSISTRDINDITYIYHAGGSINGQIESNSLEALEATYAAGGRFIELDFNWTTDGQLVCIHSFESKYSSAFSNGAVSLETFMSTKIYGKSHPRSSRHGDIYSRWQ